MLGLDLDRGLRVDVETWEAWEAERLAALEVDALLHEARRRAWDRLRAVQERREAGALLDRVCVLEDALDRAEGRIARLEHALEVARECLRSEAALVVALCA